jgi:uridylate kinase
MQFAAWIQERLEAVYKQDPRYDDNAQSLFSLDLSAPEVSALTSCHCTHMHMHDA